MKIISYSIFEANPALTNNNFTIGASIAIKFSEKVN